MEERHSYEFEKDRELRIMIDQIPLPEDSCSDFSSTSIQSPFHAENQSFSQSDLSPAHREAMFFDNSINSTIAHSSPVNQSKQFPFEDESQHNSQISQSSQGPFNIQQVSKMMDWSKTYITPTEGLFPQVSAPSMSLDPEDYQNSAYESPSREIFPAFQRDLFPRDPGPKRSHISFENLEIAKVNPPTKRTVSSSGAPERRSSREGTLSPRAQNEGANWFFAPASKRQSMNQSFKGSTQRSNQSGELVNQGSTYLLTHPMASEGSMGPLKQGSPENSDFHKLRKELSLVKIELKKEKDMNERLRNELNNAKESEYSLECEKKDLSDKVAEIEEHLMFLKTKYNDNSSLESLRGKMLEHARLEIKQLKTYLSDRERQIIELKQAFAHEVSNAEAGAKEKEIEDLTLEITKFKILDSANKKKIQELVEKLENTQRDRQRVQQDLHYKKDDYESHITNLENQLTSYQQSLNAKNSEIEQLKRALKESEGSVAAMSNQKSKEVEELKYAKMTIESLKEEIEDLKSGRVQSADYETHLQKVRSSYEKTLEKSKEEARSYKQKYDKLQEKCLVLEEQCHQYEMMLSDPDTRCMNSSVRIKDSLDERAIDKEAIEMMQQEMQKMAEVISDLRSKNNEWRTMEMHLRQEISELVKEKEDLHADFEEERNELQQKLKDYENQNYTRSKSIRSMENSLQQAREHITYLENEVEKTKASRQEIEILMEMYKKQAEEGNAIKSKPHNDIGVITSIEDLQEIKRRLESENEKCIEKFEARIKDLMVERDNAYEKLENEREDFDLQIMEKNQNIDVLREELKNSKTNRLRLEREIKKNYEDKIKALESDVEEARLSALTNNTRIQNLNDKIENLREEKKKLESELHNYKEKLFNSARELQDSVKMYQELEAQLYSYKQNLLEKSNEIESLKTTLQETERSMTSLSTSRDIDSLKKEFTSIETKYSQTLDELNSLKEEMKSLQKEFLSKSNNESKLQAQNTYLTQQIVSIEQINQEYLQRIEFLEDKVHYLEEQLRNDEAIIKEYEKESSRITHKDVSFERDSLENLKEENDKLVGIISEFKNKSEEWKNIETHLQTKISKLTKDKEEISTKYEIEIQELQQRFKELENQSTNKTRMIDMHLREKIANFEKKIIDQGKEFESEKEEWAERMQELENLIQEKEREKKELSNKLKEVMNDNSELENRLKEYNSSMKSLEEERNKIYKKNLDLQKETAQKDDKIAELEHRVEELDNANGIQGKSIKRLESSVQQFKDHIAYLEKEIEDIEVAKTESDQLADKLKKQLEETKLLKQNSKSEAGVLAENLHESAKNWETEKENLIERYEEQLRKAAKEAEQLKRKLDKQAEDYEFEMNDKNEYITSLKEDLKNLRASKLKTEREIKDMYESKILALEQDIEKAKRVSRIPISPKLPETDSISTQTDFKLLESKEQRKQADKSSKRKNSLETSSIYTQTTLDIKQMRTQLKAKFKAEFDSELRKRLQDIMSNYISYKDFDKEVAKKLEQVHDEWKTKLNKSDAKHNKKLKETIRSYETKLNEIENEYTNKIAEINLVSEEKIVKLKDFYESKIRNMKEEKEILAEQLESSKKYKFPSVSAKDDKLNEYKELVAEYDRQLKNISEQYRNYILKTKSCLENAAIEREEHKRTQEMLISKIESYEQRLQDYEENPSISPEMLSPEETCHLVINIFKRSNKESVITHLLQKNSEFLTLVHEFLEIPYEIAETDHYSQTPSRNLTFIDTAQSHMDCTLDSRPKLTLALPLNRLEAPYTENIYTTRSNLTIPRPKSVTEMLPPNVPSTRSLAISSTNRSTKRQPMISRSSPRSTGYPNTMQILEQEQYRSEEYNILPTY